MTNPLLPDRDATRARVWRLTVMVIRKTKTGLDLIGKQYVAIRPARDVIAGSDAAWCAVAYEDAPAIIFDGAVARQIADIYESDDLQTLYRIASTLARKELS